MELYQLRTFLTVVATGSLSRAAERLHIVQPALSRQIRMLEEEVGTRLFVRHARGMRLTDAGELLSGHARRALRELDQARAEIASAAGEVTGTVVLGMLPSVGGVVARGFAKRMRATCPRVALRVVAGGGGYLLKWLENREVDLAIVYEPPPPTDLIVRPLLDEPLYLIGPASETGVLEAPVSMTTLARLPLVLPSSQHELRMIIDRAAAAAGITLAVVMEADSMDVQKELVHSNIGWTVLPAGALGHDAEANRFCTHKLTGPYFTRRLALALTMKRKRPRAVDFAAEVLIHEVHDLVNGNRWPGAMLLQS